jgi:hypothetical protein
MNLFWGQKEEGRVSFIHAKIFGGWGRGKLYGEAGSLGPHSPSYTPNLQWKMMCVQLGQHFFSLSRPYISALGLYLGFLYVRVNVDFLGIHESYLQ